MRNGGATGLWDPGQQRLCRLKHVAPEVTLGRHSYGAEGGVFLNCDGWARESVPGFCPRLLGQCWVMGLYLPALEPGSHGLTMCWDRREGKGQVSHSFAACGCWTKAVLRL